MQRAWRAEAECKQLRKRLLRAKSENEDLSIAFHDMEKELRDLEFAENSARAQLMQLRVHGMGVRGRTGYGVTAFIPNEVLELLRKKDRVHVTDFIHVVAAELVERAVSSLWNINSRGKVTATIFAEVPGKPGFEVGELFDADDKIYGLKEFRKHHEIERTLQRKLLCEKGS